MSLSDLDVGSIRRSNAAIAQIPSRRRHNGDDPDGAVPRPTKKCRATQQFSNVPAARAFDARAEESCKKALVALEEPGSAPAPLPQSIDDVGISITVLTTDSNLRDAIRAAAPQRHPVLVASHLDEAAELARTGASSILIIDIVLTQAAIQRLAERVRTHQPALIIIAVGSRGDEHELMELLSAGTVDLLMLKPVTPTRAQVVIKSAAQQHRALKISSDNEAQTKQPAPETAVSSEPSGIAPDKKPEALAVLAKPQQDPADESAEQTAHAQLSRTEVLQDAPTLVAAVVHKPALPRPPWLAVLAALALVAGAVWWVMFRQLPAIDPADVIATNLAAAQRALKDGNAVAPPGRSAADYYGTVLALDPTNAEARNAIGRIADRLVDDAETSIAAGRIAVASIALESLRRVHPEDRRLRQLEVRLRVAQEKVAVSFRTQLAAAAAGTRPLSTMLPGGQRAEGATAQQKLLDARARALSQANLAIERRELDAASALIEEARTLGASTDELNALDQALAGARQGLEKENLLQLVLQRTAENRLLEPAQDSAKYYLEQLKQTDGQFAGVDQGIAALGGRLVANAQLATADKNFELAARLLSQARKIGFTGGEIETAQARLGTARDAFATASAVTQAASRTLVQLVKPVYPREALLRGIEGWVDVGLFVTSAGDVVDPQVEQSSHDRLFDRAALAAVKKWKYEPHAGGDPDDVQQMKVRVSFRLEDQK